jgi:biopolymer transport protein ExbB/TolQ
MFVAWLHYMQYYCINMLKLLLSTPSHYDLLATGIRSTEGQQKVNIRSTEGQHKVNRRSTETQQKVNKSTEGQQNVNRRSTEGQQKVYRNSTEGQQKVNRRSTECQQKVNRWSTQGLSFLARVSQSASHSVSPHALLHTDIMARDVTSALTYRIMR